MMRPEASPMTQAISNGLLPNTALGPLLRAELELGRNFAVAVGAQFFPEQRLTRAGADALFGLSLASLGPCYRAHLSERWALASCASLLLGSLGVSVASPEPVNEGARAWLAGACGLRLSFRTGALELSLSGEALAHFARKNYTVERQTPKRTESLFAEPAAGALVTFTTGARF